MTICHKSKFTFMKYVQKYFNRHLPDQSAPKPPFCNKHPEMCSLALIIVFINICNAVMEFHRILFS